MSSGLGSVGFADGFVNGFGMVDQALQRRRANEIENKKIEQDQANNLATLDFRNKELGLQGEKNSADAQYNTDRLASDTAKNNADTALKEQQLQGQIDSRKSQDSFQDKSLNFQQQNQVRDDNLRANQETRLGKEHDMEIEQKTFELNAVKKAKQKQEDLIDLSNSIGTNADGTPSFHLKNGADGIKQIKQFESSGINLPEIARNMSAYTQHVENIKTALMDPSPGTKQKAIAGLNVTEKIDINQGLGKQTDGTTVTSKEISDVIQHPPEAGYPDGYYSFAIKSIGTDAQGNPQVRDGDPMTQYRSSSPYDQNVQRVTPEQLTKRIATQENLINFVNSNPKLQQQIIKLHHEAMPKEKDKESNWTSETATDAQGNTKLVPFNKKEGKYGTPSDEQQTANDKTKWQSTIKPQDQQQKQQGNSQTVNNIINSDRKSGLQGQSDNESVKNNELEKQYRGNYRPFNDILDNPDLTAQAKFSAIRRIEKSHNK